MFNDIRPMAEPKPVEAENPKLGNPRVPIVEAPLKSVPRSKWYLRVILASMKAARLLGVLLFEEPRMVRRVCSRRRPLERYEFQKDRDYSLIRWHI